jgi:hypothetical protein
MPRAHQLSRWYSATGANTTEGSGRDGRHPSRQAEAPAHAIVAGRASALGQDRFRSSKQPPKDDGGDEEPADPDSYGFFVAYRLVFAALVLAIVSGVRDATF